MKQRSNDSEVRGLRVTEGIKTRICKMNTAVMQNKLATSLTEAKLQLTSMLSWRWQVGNKIMHRAHVS